MSDKTSHNTIGQLDTLGGLISEPTKRLDPTRELEKEIAELQRQLDRAIVQKDGMYKFRRFKMTKTMVVPPKDLTEEDANEFGYMLSGMDSAMQFWMGDWANLYVQGVKDDIERAKRYDDLAELFNINKKTIRNRASLSRNIDPSLRRDALSFTHHTLVQKMSDDDIKYWLAECELNNWSVAEFREELQGKKKKSKSLPTFDYADTLVKYKSAIPKMNDSDKLKLRTLAEEILSILGE